MQRRFGLGARILRAEIVALMGQNQIGDIEGGILKTTNPALSNDVDFFPRIPLRWGLGHMINMEQNAAEIAWRPIDLKRAKG